MNYWFQSTLQDIREKSLDVLELVRKDLSEFTTTVKVDTESYLNKIKHPQLTNLERKNDRGKNDFSSIVPVDRLQDQRIRIQNDESTYLTDPEPIEMYKTWCETNDFNDEKRKSEIAQLLIDLPQIRSFYARFVPACTTHNNFWSRYYYRIDRLDQEKIRRLDFLKRTQDMPEEHSEIDWDEPNDEWKSELVEKQVESNADQTHLSTSEISIHRNEQIVTVSTVPTTSNKTENELDDEWETWS